MTVDTLGRPVCRDAQGQAIPSWAVWCPAHGRWVSGGFPSEKEAWWALLETDSQHPMLLEVQRVELDPDRDDVSGDVPCPKCDGDGVCSECERDCVLCDGSGYLSEEAYADWERERALAKEARDKRRRELAGMAAEKKP